jgi:hypothetical protein
MITGINSSSSIENIYMYANSHYNQVQSTAVTPVTRVRPVSSLASQEDELKLAATYQNKDGVSADDDKVAWKEKANLAESYKNQEVVSYNRSNPYEMARMSMEGSLLSGMNFDMLA